MSYSNVCLRVAKRKCFCSTFNDARVTNGRIKSERFYIWMTLSNVIILRGKCLICFNVFRIFSMNEFKLERNSVIQNEFRNISIELTFKIKQ